MSGRLERADTVLRLTVGLVSLGTAVISCRYLLAAWRKQRDAELEQAAVRARFMLTTGRESMPELDAHESIILADTVFPADITDTFGSVGGLEATKRALYESVVMPLQQPELFAQLHKQNSLLAVPNGILFYGPSGTGKTLLAKAIAKSVDCTFINVKPSTLQNKWFGESNKLVSAVFSLANKLAPAIIFIDECEALMRKRGSGSDHEVSTSMRSEFLSLCDGLLTTNQIGKSVTILGCTNRPWDIDEAFLRRLPRTFLFDLPSRSERTAILEVLLRDATLSPNLSLAAIASLTEKYSGSDLKEVCRAATMAPLRKMIKKHTKDDFERVMIKGEHTNEQGTKGKAKRTQHTNQADSKVSTSTSSNAAAGASSSSASSASASVAEVAASAVAAAILANPRPLQLSDFRTAIRSIRPAGCDTLARLKTFHQQQLGGPRDEDEDDDEEEEGAGEEGASNEDEEAPSDDDDDEIYQ